MALDLTPWFIGVAGAEHSAEVARLAANAPGGNDDGIFAPTDCKVSPLSTPGASVRIGPGAWKGQNRAASGRSQAYVARVISDEAVPIAATGSSAGRTDLVCLVVRDPSVPGSTAMIPAGAYHQVLVISGVSATVTRLQQVAGYEFTTGIALARVTLPVSTSVVQASHITDLRALAQPKTDTDTLTLASTGSMSGGQNPNPLSSSTFVTWPSAATWNQDIPEWATHVTALVRLEGAASRTASLWGEDRLSFGTQATPSLVTPIGAFDVQYDTKPERVNFGLGHTVAVPKAIRGTRVAARHEARRQGGTGTLIAGQGTQTIVQLIWQERIE